MLGWRAGLNVDGLGLIGRENLFSSVYKGSVHRTALVSGMPAYVGVYSPTHQGVTPLSLAVRLPLE